MTDRAVGHPVDTLSAPGPTHHAPSGSSWRVRGAVAALMLGLLLAELDQTMFATALPTIAGDLGDGDRLFWITTVNVLAGVVVMPVLGRLGDGLGRPRVFAAALGVLVLGSVVGGLAPDLPTLLVARALQGLGGGGLIVLVQAMVADLYAPRRRAVVLSGIGAVFAVAAVAGPVLGGWLTQSVGWRWAFWLNVPVGVAAIGATCWLLHPPGPDRATLPAERGAGVPVVNTGAMVACVGSATVVLSWADPVGRPGPVVVTGVAALALASGVLFVLLERRSDHPLLPLGLLRLRTYRVAVLAGLLLAVALFGPAAYLPTYLQMAHHLDPTQAGMMMLTLVAGLGLATVGAAQVVARTGRPRALPVVGAVTGAVALGLMSWLRPDSSLVLVGAELALLGVGIGCAWEVLVVIAQSTARADTVGAATAGNGFFRELGVLGGTAVVGAVFVSRVASGLVGRPVPEGAGSWAALTPRRLAALPVEVQASVAQAYNQALTPVLGVLVLVAVACVVLLLRLPPVRLARTRGPRPGSRRSPGATP